MAVLSVVDGIFKITNNGIKDVFTSLSSIFDKSLVTHWPTCHWAVTQVRVHSRTKKKP